MTEAETKNRENELPLLKSRVKDQREMMESAFRAALKHGSRAIVELYVSPLSLCLFCIVQVCTSTYVGLKASFGFG